MCSTDHPIRPARGQQDRVEKVLITPIDQRASATSLAKRVPPGMNVTKAQRMPMWPAPFADAETNLE